ncbi:MULTISPECIES: hypothetical protein, partial [unclassified Caballeronia]|uniref:hypothetical protein n=1 Tax=unclassified Caballeronia TaxID=2646786 RepID=UPI00202829F7
YDTRSCSESTTTECDNRLDEPIIRNLEASIAHTQLVRVRIFLGLRECVVASSFCKRHRSNPFAQAFAH